MRIDVYLAQNGHAESRNKASKLIEAGCVQLDGRTFTKTSEEIDETLTHAVCIERQDSYVGRGGHKKYQNLLN